MLISNNQIITKRLILRSLKKSDYKDIYEKIFSNINVVKYTFGSESFTFEDMESFLEKIGCFEGHIGLSVIVDIEKENIIGLGGLMEYNDLGRKDYELGFIFDENHWGKGYAQEIGLMQIEYAKNILKVDRILALASPDNKGSINAIKKIGLKYKKDIPNSKGIRSLFIKDFIDC